MPNYLLDTNIILQFSNPSDTQHAFATDAVAKLLERGEGCYLAPQVLIEMWVVATRPVDVNGLGWSTEHAYNIIEQLLERFPLVEESPEIFHIWLDLVMSNGVKGKRTHDVRIIAAMQAAQVTHILTLNPSDFSDLSDIVIVHPRDIVES